MRVVLMASGRGTNVQALLAAQPNWRADVRFVGLVSDRPEAPAIDLAKHHGLPTHIVTPSAASDRDHWNRLLGHAVADLSPDLVVMAGFMRVVSADALRMFGVPAINVHPALLPAFPGAHAIRDALAAGVRVTGVTVHQVIAEVDAGPVLEQEALRVLPHEDEPALAARIHAIEHRVLPRVVHALAVSAALGNHARDEHLRQHARNERIGGRRNEDTAETFEPPPLAVQYRTGLALLDEQSA